MEATGPAGTFEFCVCRWECCLSGMYKLMIHSSPVCCIKSRLSALRARTNWSAWQISPPPPACTFHPLLFTDLSFFVTSACLVCITIQEKELWSLWFKKKENHPLNYIQRKNLCVENILQKVQVIYGRFSLLVCVQYWSHFLFLFFSKVITQNWLK